MKRPGFNGRRVVVREAHYENGRYVPPVYVGDRSLATPVSTREHLSNGWRRLNKPREVQFNSKPFKIAILGIFLIWLASGILIPHHTPFPLAHADYNSTFTHTRTQIASCTAASGCFTSARWSYNSTCVNNNIATWLNFSYSVGTTGAGGNNCASASIAKLNSPINLQIASGKQLEMYVDWRNTVNTNTRETLASVILRTNSTVPSFRENWNPSADPAVRFRWDICPANLGCNSGNGQMDTYITHTDTGTVTSEGGANIDVISGNAACVAPHDCVYQEVLNFTGPTNFYFQKDLVAGSSTSASTTSASALQQGRDYYLFLMVGWNTGIAPTAGANVLFVSNTFDGSIPGILTWSFVSVPSSCNDVQAGNQKLAACGAIGIAVPSFDINPLDPSSWANAIIKGLVWAASAAFAAIGPVLGTIYGAFINGLDIVGGWLGLGAIGSAFAGALKGFADWIINIFGNIFLQSLNFVNFITSGLTLMINGVSNYWAGATAFIAQLVDLLSQGWTFVTSTLKFGNLGIKWLVVVWLVWGILASADSIPGFMNWFTISMLLTVRLFHGLYWIGDQAFLTILRAKQLIAQWM